MTEEQKRELAEIWRLNCVASFSGDRAVWVAFADDLAGSLGTDKETTFLHVSRILNKRAPNMLRDLVPGKP